MMGMTQSCTLVLGTNVLLRCVNLSEAHRPSCENLCDLSSCIISCVLQIFDSWSSISSTGDNSLALSLVLHVSSSLSKQDTVHLFAIVLSHCL